MDKKYGGFEVRGFKPFASPDGGGFNATLYKNGKKVATLFDGGHGGEIDLDGIYNRKTQKHVTNGRAIVRELNEIAKAEIGVITSDIVRADGTQFSYDADWTSIVHQLIEDFESRKWEKRQCKNKILFKLPETPADSWEVIKTPYTADMKRQMVEKWGDKIVCILNEELAK